MNIKIINKTNLESDVKDQILYLRSRCFSEISGQEIIENWTNYDQEAEHFVCFDEKKIVGLYRIRKFDSYADIITDSKTAESFSMENLFTPSLKEKKFLELSRAAIHPEYRDGKAITLIWVELTKYILDNNIDYCFGMTSVFKDNPMKEICYIKEKGKDLYTLVYPVKEHFREYLFFFDKEKDCNKKEVTTLVKGYCKQGAEFSIYPAWDNEWKCWDFFTIFSKDSLTNRFKKSS